MKAAHRYPAGCAAYRNRKRPDLCRAVDILLRVPVEFDRLCLVKGCLLDYGRERFRTEIAGIFDHALKPCFIPFDNAGQVLDAVFVQRLCDLQQGLPGNIGCKNPNHDFAFRRMRCNDPVFPLVAEGNVSFLHVHPPSDTLGQRKAPGKAEAERIFTDHRDAFNDLPKQVLVKIFGWSIVGHDLIQRSQGFDDLVILILH